ncbi:MAG TPA: gluconeogenesis factor YvcK family protein [Candidatus Dormibacteraeota bacterium]
MSLRRPGSLRWLQPGLHIKRWLLLAGLSVFALSLGASYALRGFYATGFRLPQIFRVVTLNFLPKPAQAAVFAAIGLAALIFALRQLSRAMLVPFLKGDEDLADVYYRHRTMQKGPRIVTIGGGTGLSALLRGIKVYTANLTAIVTVADDGGSSGKLREQYRILPPGDFRQCLTALAETEPLMTELFQHRFSQGALDGHAFGNLFIMAMAEITGDFEHALRESGKVLAVRGTILPSTVQDVTLVAELVDGQEAVGESRIPLSLMPIRHVYLEPRHALINPEAEQAILDAELITVGPGSLFTSILPNLLVEGMVSTLKKARAPKVYICNVATQRGETDGFSVADHLEALENHVGGDVFDYVLVNSNLNYPLPPSAQAAGAKVVNFDRTRVLKHGVRVVMADVVNEGLSTHHDPDKLSRAVMKQVFRKAL